MEALAQNAAGTSLVLATAPHLYVLVNRRAGWVRRQTRLEQRLARVLGHRGTAIFTSDPDGLDGVMRGLRRAGARWLALCGGDGTNLQLLNAIAGGWHDAPWPQLSLLAGGSVNLVARNLGADEPVERRLSRLLRGTPLQRREQLLLRVNGRHGFVFGALLISRLMARYEATRPGRLSGALLALRTMLSAARGTREARRLFATQPVRLRRDDGPWQTHPLSALLGAVIAAPAVGMRATALGGVDRRLHLVGSGAAPEQLVRAAPALWTGLPSDALTVDARVQSAEIAFRDQQPFTLDGEMFSARTLRLEVAGPVTLLEPPRRT